MGVNLTLQAKSKDELEMVIESYLRDYPRGGYMTTVMRREKPTEDGYYTARVTRLHSAD